MIKRSLLICTSVAALTIATGSAMAQGERASPEGGRGAPAEMAPSAGRDGPPASRMEGAGEGSVNAEQSGRAERAGSASRNRAEGSSVDKPAKNAGKQKPDGSASTGASEGDAGRDTPRSAEKAGKRSKDDAANGSREDNASSGASEGTEGKDHGSTGSVTQLSGEKRSKAQSAFQSHRSDAVVKDVHVDLSIGVAVPRSVTLYAVPEDVVVIAPEYRRYKYFIYEDRVVIVDPVSLAIVDILILT